MLLFGYTVVDSMTDSKLDKMKPISAQYKECEAKMAKLRKDESKKNIAGLMNWLQTKIKGGYVEKGVRRWKEFARRCTVVANNMIVRCERREETTKFLLGQIPYHLLIRRDIPTKMSAVEHPADYAIWVTFVTSSCSQ